MKTPTPSLALWEQWFGRRGSLRTQLIVWNILALTVLLGVLGAVIRQTVHSFLMTSVNSELERQVQRGACLHRGMKEVYDPAVQRDLLFSNGSKIANSQSRIFLTNTTSPPFENFNELHIFTIYGTTTPRVLLPALLMSMGRTTFPGPRDFGGRPGRHH